MKITVIAGFLFISCCCRAGEPPSAVKQEIEHLFSYLETSGCQFNRNGSWYAAPDAVAHIRKKYDYLADKNLVKTAEFFIEKAASQSSMSGKPYWVRCAGQAETLSSLWFGNELKAYRNKPVVGK